MATNLGRVARVLDRAGVSALEPAVRIDVAGGVYYLLDCHLSPRRFMMAVKRELARKGALFLWGIEARRGR
jgi:D-amino-acid dehydrogenase